MPNGEGAKLVEGEDGIDAMEKFQFLVETNLTLGNADAETTPRPDFCCIHQGSATSSQNAEILMINLAGKGFMSENKKRQAAGSGSGGSPSARFWSSFVERSGFLKREFDGASSSKEKDVEDKKEGFITPKYGRRRLRQTGVNQVNVYIDMQTVQFNDLASVDRVKLEINTILAEENLPALADGSKYESSEITCYISQKDPNIRSIRTRLHSLGIKIKQFDLRKAVCRDCKPGQIAPHSPPRKKPALLEMEMVSNLLWHVYRLEQDKELNAGLAVGKKQKQMRNTVMWITGDIWLRSYVEGKCLNGYRLVTTIPPCMTTKLMSMSKHLYWEQH